MLKKISWFVTGMIEWVLAKVSDADADWITYVLTDDGLKEVRGE